ncbi:phosphotransferase [Mycolicibacterium sp. 120270]|uniref:phosphotransferase n=1 Tax=Mycolicibacterium sp. 120270 TaxID=3090600 RepID=UPI00299ED0E5|nr:phosphotransferase [Mycolicibacterium sp. 120270]MDX1884438.1 phosphotransferase [Mycolicibacterium sp. 120270]
MTAEQLADRTRRATNAAVDAARELGLRVDHPEVLHDLFSVVVHLAPEPVVARIPVVLTAGTGPDDQSARQQRELDVAAWLDEQGVPVVPPSRRVPRVPVRRDGFSMTFWELADVADDHEPYSGVDVDWSAELHARIAGYPGPLPFLAPFNRGLPEIFAVLDDVDLLSPAEVKRARDEYETLRSVLSDRTKFEAAFPDVGVQPIQGDGPSHNVIRTRSGIRFSDFEDVALGPVEWDLAMMGPDAVAQYDIAAVQRGLRRTDPRMQRVMDAGRRLQFVACLTLIPQLPLLADGLKSVLDEWRTTPLIL